MEQLVMTFGGKVTRIRLQKGKHLVKRGEIRHLEPAFGGSRSADRSGPGLPGARAKSKQSKVISFDRDFEKLGSDWEEPG